jgi:hypothetical protein
MDLLGKIDFEQDGIGLNDEERDELASLSLGSDEVAQLPAEQRAALDKLDYIPDDRLPENVQRKWLPHLEAGVEFLTFVGNRTNISVPYRLQRHKFEQGTAILVNLNNTQFNATVEGRVYRWVYPELQSKQKSRGRKKVKHDVEVSDEGDETTVTITVKSRKYDDVEVSFAEGITTTELNKLIKQQLADAGWNPNTAISRAQNISKREAKAGRAILTKRGKRVE